MFKIALLLQLLSLALSFSGIAQSVPTVASLKAEYPDEKAVFLVKKEAINVDIVNGELQIITKHHLDKLLIDDNGQAYANHTIHYSPVFYDVEDIVAEVFTPKGSKYKKQRIDNIETKSSYSGMIFYDDSKETEIKFPNMGAGQRAVVSYQENIKDAHFLSAFYFSSYMPILYGELTITFPKSVKVNYKSFNLEGTNVKFSTIQDEKSTTYKWTVINSKSFEVADNAPAISYYEPHVAIYIDRFEIEGKEPQRVLSDVSDLFGWYTSLITEVNQDEDPTLKNIVDSLLTGNETPREKIEKVFYWVQDHIKYVAFEDGLGGFIPRQASLVCTRRFGDCKDMASIITDMLRYAGIEAYLTWIGSRDIPYRYEELPTPMVDNHMIASTKLDGEFIFLDATGSYTPLGMPTSFIQGKEAMVKLADGSFEIVEVPAVVAQKNHYKDEVTVQLDGKNLIGQGTATLDGYVKFTMTHKLKNKLGQKRDDYLKGWLEKGNNKFLINDYSVNGLNDKVVPLEIEYKFSIGSYASLVGEEAYVNLHLDRVYENAQIDIEKRKGVAREIDYKKQETHITNLDIPEGYEVTELPENQNFIDGPFSFSVKYSQTDSQVRLEKIVKIDTLLIEKEQFDQWNNLIDALDDAYGEVVVLKKK